jgi:ferredoxin
MKNLNFKKARKLLLVLTLVTFLFTPVYSMIDGYGCFIDYDNCFCCGTCHDIAPEYIGLLDNEYPFFRYGKTVIGDGSAYLNYPAEAAPVLREAYECCPAKDQAFLKGEY